MALPLASSLRGAASSLAPPHPTTLERRVGGAPPRLLYYLQTFHESGEHQLEKLSPLVPAESRGGDQKGWPWVGVYLSSLHFGQCCSSGTDSRAACSSGQKGSPCLRLNDDDVESDKVKTLLQGVERASSRSGIRPMVMLGGAGGAYTDFFHPENDDSPAPDRFYSLERRRRRYHSAYYDKLRGFLREHPWISGIDLNVEDGPQYDSSSRKTVGTSGERTASGAQQQLANIRHLISSLDADFSPSAGSGERPFAITMAPVAPELVTRGAGSFGNFAYSELEKTPEGARVDWYNVQAYDSHFDAGLYRKIVANGYAPSKLVMGMLGDATLHQRWPDGAMEELRYMGSSGTAGEADADAERGAHAPAGSALWEYGDTMIDPVEWGRAVLQVSAKREAMVELLGLERALDRAAGVGGGGSGRAAQQQDARTVMVQELD